jgi:hypothetical protein
VELKAAWIDAVAKAARLRPSGYAGHETLETRQGMKVACLEEIAIRQGLIDREQRLALAKSLQESGCGNYPMEIAQSTEEALQSHTAARPTNKVNFNGDGGIFWRRAMIRSAKFTFKRALISAQI